MGGFQGRIKAVPKPFMPRSLRQFLAAHAGGGAPNIVYPDRTSQNLLFIELEQVVPKRVWVSPLEYKASIKISEYKTWCIVAHM